MYLSIEPSSGSEGLEGAALALPDSWFVRDHSRGRFQRLQAVQLPVKKPGVDNRRVVSAASERLVVVVVDDIVKQLPLEDDVLPSSCFSFGLPPPTSQQRICLENQDSCCCLLLLPPACWLGALLLASDGPCAPAAALFVRCYVGCATDRRRRRVAAADDNSPSERGGKFFLLMRTCARATGGGGAAAWLWRSSGCRRW